MKVTTTLAALAVFLYSSSVIAAPTATPVQPAAGIQEKRQVEILDYKKAYRRDVPEEKRRGEILDYKPAYRREVAGEKRQVEILDYKKAY